MYQGPKRLRRMTCREDQEDCKDLNDGLQIRVKETFGLVEDFLQGRSAEADRAFLREQLRGG